MGDVAKEAREESGGMFCFPIEPLSGRSDLSPAVRSAALMGADIPGWCEKCSFSGQEDPSMFPSTVERVPDNTSSEVNARIRRQTEERVAWTARRGPIAIERRLDELDHEWDIERVLEANASTLMLVGVALGAKVDRKFLAIPAAVAAFLLMHAVQGWCPPLPVLRRLGVRTQAEIEAERYALKAMRGDFRNAVADGPRDLRRAEESLRAART